MTAKLSKISGYMCDDAIDQLVSATLKNSQTQAVIKQFVYAYDKAGNRVSEQIDSSVRKSTHNNLNQLVSQEAGGPIRFRGSLNEPATVTVAGKSANVVSNTFEGTTEVSPGTNVVPIIARDFSGNERTNRYQVVVPSGETKTLTYDANGNCMSDGVRIYSWDAANRLVTINQGTHRSEFVYDGLGRRVQIIEKENNAEVSNKRFLWDGLAIAEERDSSGANVTRRFYPQGEQISSSNYYFTRDHLGSIREMTDNTGAIRARYEYDPYGRRTKVSGDLDADFGFTGHYVHAPTGLCLALYRAYDPDLGRWLSRDPIGEDGGINLYGYVFNNPTNYFDPSGKLATLPLALVAGTVGAVSSLAVGGGWQGAVSGFAGGFVGGLVASPIVGGAVGGLVSGLVANTLNGNLWNDPGAAAASVTMSTGIGFTGGLFIWSRGVEDSVLIATGIGFFSGIAGTAYDKLVECSQKMAPIQPNKPDETSKSQDNRPVDTALRGRIELK